MNKIDVPTTPLANSTKINCSILSAQSGLDKNQNDTSTSNLSKPTSSTFISANSSNIVKNIPSITVKFADEDLESMRTSTSSSVSNISKDSAISLSSNSSTTSSSSSVNGAKEKSAKPVAGTGNKTHKVKGRKSVKPSSDTVKPSSDTLKPVEKILKDIKMSKYSNKFKTMDLQKFKQLREIDLKAFGVTRPSEITIFKVAIKNLKNSETS